MRAQQSDIRPSAVGIALLAGCALLAGGPTAKTAFAADDGREVEVEKVAVADDGDGTVVRRVIVDQDGKQLELLGDHPHLLFTPLDHALLGGGFLGVELAELTPELRAHFGVPGDAGVMVSRVVDDSAAARAGLLVGDIITRADGKTVDSGHALAMIVHGHEEGEEVPIEYWRDRRLETTTAAVDARSDLPHRVRRMAFRCGDGEDCDFLAGHELVPDFDCGDEHCEVKVECDGGDCNCVVNGESTDCDEFGWVQRLDRDEDD